MLLTIYKQEEEAGGEKVKRERKRKKKKEIQITFFLCAFIYTLLSPKVVHVIQFYFWRIKKKKKLVSFFKSLSFLLFKLFPK